MTNAPNNHPDAKKAAKGLGHSFKQVALDPQRWKKILLALLAIGGAIALIAIFGQWLGGELPRFELWIKSLGWWGPAAFILAFVILTTAQVPESLLAIASGVVFGLWEGFAAVVVASVLASLFSFYFYRLVFRDRLESMLRKHPKAHAIEAAVSSQGFKLLVLLRLGPFNFSLLNAILGASTVRVAPFLLSMVGAIPGNFATVYFGRLCFPITRIIFDPSECTRFDF